VPRRCCGAVIATPERKIIEDGACNPYRLDDTCMAILAARRLCQFRTRIRAGSTTNNTMATTNASIIWFRKGLRLHDNPALLEAIKGADALYPVFCLDPTFLQPDKVGANRIAFLLESLQDLDASLKARKSRLIVLRGSPEEVLVEKIKEWRVTKLCFESDTEPYAKVRDARVGEAAKAMGVEVLSPVSHTLYDPDVLIAKNGGKAPLTMQSFQKIVDKAGAPPAPAADPPSTLPSPGGVAVVPEDSYKVPTLVDIGYGEEHTKGADKPVHGGESAALARLARYVGSNMFLPREKLGALSRRFPEL